MNTLIDITANVFYHRAIEKAIAGIYIAYLQFCISAIKDFMNETYSGAC